MAEEPPGEAALRVLVVDDHAIVREAVASMARDAGYVVFEAISGEQAVELASSVRPDLVIMDVLMPGMSGIEAAGQIAARHPEARVVMLSVADSAETVRAAMRAGAAGYLTKTAASRATVLDALRRTAAGERVFAPPGLVDVLVRDPALLPRAEATQLTLREKEIITLAAQGVANADIAGALGLSPRTVENHLARIYRKLGITSRTQLAKVAIDQQIDRYPWAGQVCTVMLVDIVAFGAPDRSSRDQLALREAMYQILREAFTRSGIPWPASQMEDRGDGVLIIVPPGVPTSTIIGPCLTALVQELGRYNRTAAGSASMQLRVALDAGPVAADALGVSGQAIILASRLIDAPPFREGLPASGADLGVIVSESVYDTVITQGDLGLDRAYLRSVDIRVKELETTAWMWFSGRALSSGSPEADDIEARLERLRRRPRDSARALPAMGHTLRSGAAASRIGGPYGQDNDALRLIRDFLTRGNRASTPQPDDDPSPVLVFEGPRGIGKTTLLRTLADQLDQQVPYASLDCEEFRGDARALLALLAFDLNRHSGGYGRLRFPRLVTGQLVISAHLETASRPQARDEVRRWLELHQRSGAALGEKVTGELIAGLESAPASWAAGPGIADLASTQGARLILGGHVSTSRGRRLLLRTGQDWYGHQDRGLNRDSLDVLADLNRRATSPHADDSRAVTQLLCAAFLADLRNSSRKNQPVHCVLLFDNADAATAPDLLDGLQLNRTGQADPLTVIATSRGALSARLHGEERTALTDASYADYLRRRQHRPARWLYAVALPGLTRDQTELMVVELGLQGNSRQSADMIHHFTAGHPGATQVLVAAIAEHPNESTDLLALLSQSAAGRHSAEEHMLSQFLQGLPPAAIDDLVTCSAARHREDALRLAARSDLLTYARGADPVLFSDELWWWCGTAASHAVLHPVPRRLLLRRLSMRDEGAPDGWTRVCELLKAESEVTGDDTGTMYYALALGNIQHVASRLTTALDLTGATEWLRLLQSVADAPNRLDHRQPVYRQLSALTQWAEPGQQLLASVARLLAASWICSDPLSAGHRRELYQPMAEDLQIIAHHHPQSDHTAFYSRINEYRDTGNM